ncbi:MAG: adenylate/guanylate cyclase domain-containing protein, partial [Bacteroidales bacterium]|nr:adenylate/guanylate cyclase domain-containing protein [Bacteroidales bacterium]
EDELGRLAILRTNDEIGELANGYNEMAMRITGNITALKEITEANQRFVPEEFLQILGKKSITDVALGDQIQKHMTILFIDIRSFTTISEKLSPKENFDFLNDYLGYMEPVIRAHNGFIDKFIGDSIMALFGDKAEDAIDAALEMHERLKEFNLMLKQVGRPPIDTGAGIHSGNLMLGVVGGEGRMETTVISDSVNLASRLEGLTRNYDAFLIVSESTLELVENKNSYTYKYLDEVKVKGRTGAVKVYAVTDKIKV